MNKVVKENLIKLNIQMFAEDGEATTTEANTTVIPKVEDAKPNNDIKQLN
ncbi:MAG: hypothetical protein ACRC42_03120 [Mycoplasma sp.]